MSNMPELIEAKRAFEIWLKEEISELKVSSIKVCMGGEKVGGYIGLEIIDTTPQTVLDKIPKKFKEKPIRIEKINKSSYFRGHKSYAQK